VDDGGATITDYEFSTDDGTSWTSAGSTVSPITISGLALGTVYAVRLRAVNSVGAGDSSTAVSVAGLSSFNPTNITGMNVWLDGQVVANAVISAGKVTSWTDRSGSANDFTASAGGTITYDLPSGINGRPAMNFTTSFPDVITYLGKDNFNIAPSNKLSVFLVVRQTGNGASGNSELFFTRNNYQYLDIFNRTNSDGILCLNIGSATTNSTSVDILTTPPTNAVISLVADTTASMFVNGDTTPVSGATRGGLSLNDATLDWAISGAAFLGNVGEVMCFAAPLNTVQRQAVEGYLAWKWGTQASLPVGHPYTASPPTLTLPNPPTSLIGTPGNTEASIAFTPGANGGTAITNYQYSIDGGATFTAFSPAQTTSPVTITGLTNGTAYTIKLKTVTAFGVSDASESVSVTPAPVVSGSPNVLILGDGSAGNLTSGLQSAKTNLGYTGTMTLTTKNVFGADSGYTGGDLSSYDVVILYTNGGGTPSSALGANLNTFVSGGGKFIMGVFSWGNVPSFPGLTYSDSSTYQYKGTQAGYSSSVTNLVSHPILSGINPASIVISNFYTSGILLNSGATSIAQLNEGTSFLAVKESGSAKLVGINAYPALGTWESSDGNKNIYRYLVNSIYWCIGSLT
jgi:titin